MKNDFLNEIVTFKGFRQLTMRVSGGYASADPSQWDFVSKYIIICNEIKLNNYVKGAYI